MNKEEFIKDFINPCEFNEQSCDCTCDYGSDGPRGKPTIMDYIGNGVWKCPKCGTIEDNHKNDVYKIRMKFEKQTYPDKSVELKKILIEPFDPKLLVKLKNSDGSDTKTILKEILEEEIVEGEHFENHEEGTFIIEILWYSYRCSYEYEEYDTVFEIISEIKKPILPCDNCKSKDCKEIIGEGNFKLRPCERYRVWRKQISDWMDIGKLQEIINRYHKE